MNVKEVLKGIEILKVYGQIPDDLVVRGIAQDSREVAQDSLFVAVRGRTEDGHRFISDAVSKKASVIVLEDEAFLEQERPSVPCVIVRDSRKALVKIAGTFFGQPYSRIRSIGITGTNGKTTTSYLVRSILNTAGLRCGLIGTIGYKITDTNIPSLNTTPGIVELHRLIKDMADSGNKYVAMEVSSHALDQKRVAGMVFCAAIFTNLTQDHLDYHENMESYFSAKERLFIDYADKHSHFILNTDDAFGKRLFSGLGGKKLSYGFSGSDIALTAFDIQKNASIATISTPQGKIPIVTKLVGRHNLYNILAAVALAVSEGVCAEDIRRGIEAVTIVPGRLERIDSQNGFSVFVDYAHTDDALKNVLECLRGILHNGRIITVFGCGGDRDKGKRPKMGCIASALSDYCIITSDNPRSEDPSEIARHIISGIVEKNFEVELDRFCAIQKALSMAGKDDFVLVAGKGHEAYQIIGNKISEFDDKAAVLKILSGQRTHV